MKSILLALVMSSATLFSQDNVTLVQDQRVVRLITRKKANEAWTATAFFVSPTRLLTAAHTFEKSNDQWIIIDGKEVHCKIIRIDFKKDVAVLESDVAVESFYKISSKIIVKGFPHGGAGVSAVGFVDDKRTHSKIYFTKGMSGGPVENESGEVIGMGVQGDSENGESSCKFIPASVLAEFAK